MKKFLALLLICAMLMTTLASCDWFGGNDPEPPVCTEHADADENYVCDNCGAELEKPDLPPACTEHKDEDGDYACDDCGYVMFENVKYTLNIGDLETGGRTSDDINGPFTIVAGSEVRNRTKTFEGVEYIKSVKIGSNTSKIKVNVPGTGKLSFLVQNGSSGADMQFITVTAPDGTKQDIEFVGNAESSPVVKIEVEVTEGEWIISRGKNGGTQDIFYLELECLVAVAPENGFELVSAGQTDFLVGDELDLSKLRLNATYENGKTDALELNYTIIDTSKVDMSKEGVYTITISYKEYTPITYQVRVYAPSMIELGYDAIEKLAQNSSAGNGVYYNQHFREVYAVGEDLDTVGLSVIVVAKCGDDVLKFKVDDYEITGFDSSEAGMKELKISAYGIEEYQKVFVIGGEPVAHVRVDNKNGDILPGDIVDGYMTFTSIHQALEYLARVPAAEQKILEIGEGLYTEKLEIILPNLTIRGAGADKTTIEWDSLYGLVDDGGFTHTTDSTATVAVREQAVNCVIEDITISNYWNSQERMNEAGLGIERGLALLVQADRFIMKDSALLGIQDTLELFTGRQYFENVYISGYTDFIFGTNNTTYFKSCTIHVIDTEKDDKGTAGYITAFKGSNKGEQDAITYGAIFDGCVFTADEGVTLGCTAIGRPWGAYAAVAVMNSELGGHISVKGYETSKNERYVSMTVKPTDATAQFVEYNNTGDGAISEAVAGMRMLTAEEAALYADFATIFGTINRNVAYLDPWDPTSNEVQIDDRDYYYFNGSSSATGTSHTFDTATSIVKGETLEWDGLLISAEAGNVAWNSNANALNMKSGAFIKFTVAAGTTVTVETYPNYNYFTLNGVGTASANMLTQYYAEETEVTLLSTGDLYIYSIIINPDEEAPAAAELNELKASGMNLNYVVGDELSLEGLVLKAIYSDNSILIAQGYTVDSSAVNKDAEGEYEVVISYGGKSVTLTVTYEDPNAGPEISKNTTLDFTTVDGLEAVQNNPKVTISGSVRHNGGEIQIQGTISFQVKAGTVVTVVPYANSSYASFKLYPEDEPNDIVVNEMYSMMFFDDCTVVYEGLSNNYLCQIIIECPIAEGKYVFGGSSVEGDVTGILESIPGMSVTGTCKTHSGGAQLGGDSQIMFIAPTLATITIQGYDTNYGQLLVLVDGIPVEMNSSAQYVINCLEPSSIMIQALNVGTEEAPAYNKSYITYIDVSLPEYVDKDTTITFGSEGNYKDSVIDFSGITIGDNGGNNSQVKNGSFSFAVKKGAVVTVHAYPGYACYNLGDGDIIFEGLTDEYFSYSADRDCVITISHTSGNNYFYSVEIAYPVEVKPENVSITFGSEGNYNTVDALDMSEMAARDNGGNNTQLSSGSMKITVFAGATVKIHGYPGYTSYTISDGTDTTEEITTEEYTYTVEADGELVITAVNSNNYFYGIDIIY